MNYTKRGINTLDEVVVKTIQYAKEKFGIEASEADIVKAMTEVNQVAKKQVSDEIAALRKNQANIKRDARSYYETQKKIETLEQKLKYEYSDLPRKPKRDQGALLTEQKARAKKLEGALDRKVAESKLSKMQKFGREAAAFPRALQSTFDMSAVLRQGLLIGAGNPKKAMSALGAGARAMFDTKFADRVAHELTTGPKAKYRERMGLYLSPTDGSYSRAADEQWMSSLASRLPVLRHAEQSYTTYLNKLRADVFDSTVDMVGDMSESEAKALARFINVGSGRGELGGFEHAANSLATAFFSPRLLAARIQAPMDALGLTSRGRDIYKSRGARRQIISSWLALLGVGGTVMALAKAGGAELESDPNSSDWGKIKAGDTRFDIWGGFQQPMRLFAMTAKNAYQRANGEKPDADLQRAALQFLRYKASPNVNIVSELASGKNAIGQDRVPLDALQNLAPMYLKELYEIITNPQTPNERKAASAAAAFFGVGVNTYKKKG